jgi:hypothetical protein
LTSGATRERRRVGGAPADRGLRRPNSSAWVPPASMPSWSRAVSTPESRLPSPRRTTIELRRTRAYVASRLALDPNLTLAVDLIEESSDGILVAYRVSAGGVVDLLELLDLTEPEG